MRVEKLCLRTNAGILYFDVAHPNGWRDLNLHKRGAIFMMRMICRISLVVFLAALAVSFTSPQASAQQHPAYLHALSDLRFARALLQRPDGGELRAEERDAIHKIDDAINEIKRASIDDHKDIGDHPPVDMHLPWAGRLHKALEMLDDARRDCQKEEDNPRTQGLQLRVLKHIEEAHHHVEEAIAIVH
jgi:hypothetical protein